MIRIGTIFFVSASLSLLSSWSVADEQCEKGALPETQAAEASTFLASTYPAGDNPGVAVLVACAGETIYAFNSGMANIEWRQPNSSSTSFRLGSISKPITAVAILQLVEQGKVELDAPIADYVPLLPQYMRPVTVRQLMSHTSGLPDILLTPTLLPLARDWVSIRQVIEMQANTPPRFAPGEKFDYSNFNYVLLAALVEAVTDTAYGDYMNESVFQALGMMNSHYDARRTIIPQRAQGYEVDAFGTLKNSENIDVSHSSAAGALMSSAVDISKWSHLLMSGELLAPEMRGQAWSPQVTASGEPSSYGLGFNVSEEQGRRVIWHNGLASGFQTAFSMYPDHGLTVVVLSNGFHLPNTTAAMDQIAHLVLAAEYLGSE